MVGFSFSVSVHLCVHNAAHYVLYSGMRRQRNINKKLNNAAKRGGSKLNCCKIWPLGKHDHLLKPHYGRKRLAYCTKRVIARYYDSDRCGRQRERERDEKPSDTSKSVPAISAPRPSQQNPGIERRTLTLSLVHSRRISLQLLPTASQRTAHVPSAFGCSGSASLSARLHALNTSLSQTDSLLLLL